MASVIQPYLFFGGRCEEALEFYQKALGAKAEMLMRFNESPEPVPADKLAPGFEKKVMHASFRIGDSVLMASDGCDTVSKFQGFSLSVSAATEGEVDKIFGALSEGGKVTMPLGKTFWSKRFGMLEDKFGMGWMVGIMGN